MYYTYFISNWHKKQIDYFGIFISSKKDRLDKNYGINNGNQDSNLKLFGKFSSPFAVVF